MFEALTQKLRTIDTVLSENLLEFGNWADRENGFDPQKSHTAEELARISPVGPEAFKLTGEESKYLLLEVRLEGNGQTFSEVYLRGFDYIIDSHPVIAQAFLGHDVGPAVEEHFEVPSWPSVTPRTVEIEKDGLKL